VVVEWPGRIGPLDEFTLGEAAETLNLSPRLLGDLVDDGQIPARTIGSVVWISRADIEVFRRRTETGGLEVAAEIHALFPLD
jgi:excisionase family DNA binding protein